MSEGSPSSEGLAPRPQDAEMGRGGVSSPRINLREPFCGISHGVGAIFSSAGLVYLLQRAHGRPLPTFAFAIYGASLILLYAASALYHSLRVGPRAATRLMRLDHAAIYLLIAGTYTPVCLLVLPSAWGRPIFAGEWLLALSGLLLTLFWPRAPHPLRVGLYLVMGWLIVAAFGPLRATLPPAAFHGILAGGLAYTVGVVVYATDWPHLWRGRFSSHDLWHVFVLVGSAFHYAVIARYLAGAVAR